VFSVAPCGKVREVAATLKAIHAAEDRAAALAKAAQVIEKLEQMKLPAAAEKVRVSIEETLTYYSFSETHWRRICTNNPLERLMREIRRRTKVVGAFPDDHCALMLAAVRLRHVAGPAGGVKRYLCMEPLMKQVLLTPLSA
jgi:transposase-like protein